MTELATRIIIRHLSGSKTNQIEQFDLDGLQEITIGRDPTSKVSYDLQRDDEVSRKHAVIRVKHDKTDTYFRLADQNSSNGTLLNGERIGGEVELLPDDIVELGANGPKFVFDLQPRPANLPARTRQMGAMGAIEAAATRIVAASAATGTTAEISPVDTRSCTGATDTSAVARVPVGKQTILRMIGEERSRTRQVWIAALAAVLILAVLGGGGLYWNNKRSTKLLEDQLAAATQSADAARAATDARLATQLGIGPAMIKKLGDATVYVQFKWALFDLLTRQPLFQRYVKIKGEELPCFVKMSDGTVVRWLTTDDDGHGLYRPIGENATGTGFVVDERGFILTNKHVASAWQTRWEDQPAGDTWWAAVYTLDRSGRDPTRTDLDTLNTSDLRNWIPGNNSYVFETDRPVRLSSGTRQVYATNEILNVQFPGTRMPVAASVLRTSIDADVAVIKIDSTQSLNKIDLAPDGYNVQVGEKILLLGYPGVSATTIAVQKFTEAGHVTDNAVSIPEPTVTQGIISKLSPPMKTDQGEITTLGTTGDTYQLDIFAAPGDSGGPVLNAQGKVIALLTYHSTQAEHVSFAVPVKYVRELLQLQRDTSP
jgi:S1-C subfamily serine protease